MKTLIFAVFILLFFSSCSNQNNTSNHATETGKDSAIGTIEWYDSSAAKAIDSNATIEVIGKGFTWAEGPLWIAAFNKLIFSDVPENKIFEWTNGNAASLYLMPAGYTKKDSAKGEIGSNGLALDQNNNLLLCQSGNRQLARMNAPINSPKPDYTSLAATYKGKRFNSPNDLAVNNKNDIYFTDPVYGLLKGADDPARELKFEGVFKLSAGGKLSLLIDSIPRPNGIAFSPDESILYIASSDEYKPAWYAYQLDANGDIKRGGKWLDALPLKAKATQKQGPDGMKIDKYGNLFGAGPDGINIISPQGKLIALIKVYNRFTSNCSFSVTKDTLFVTADDEILRVKLR